MVYFEKQVAALCGQHLLNNLFQQGPIFTPDRLAEIAAELDAQERAIGASSLGSASYAFESQNVDDAGNFSVQVLDQAMQQANGARLVRDKEAVRSAMEAIRKTPSCEGDDGRPAFVLHFNDHWFCVRYIKGSYWILNSLHKKPSRITPTFLEVTLAQFQLEGWSVFAVQGDLPAPAPEYAEDYENEPSAEGRSASTRPFRKARGQVNTLSMLQAEEDEEDDPSASAKKSTKKFRAFEGVGHRVGGSKHKPSPQDESDMYIDDAELDMMAEAIRASLADAPQSTQGSSSSAVEYPAIPSTAVVGLSLVMPGTGRRVRHKFPVGSTAKDLVDFTNAQTEIQAGAPLSFMIQGGGLVDFSKDGLTALAPSATLIVKNEA